MEFATGALGTLLPKLGQLLQGEYKMQKSVRKDIQFLMRELETTHAALRNVGEVPVEQLNELVKTWARDVKELSFDMEDIVDTFLVRVEGPEQPSKKSCKKFMRKMKDMVTKGAARHHIAQDIKSIREQVVEVAARRDRYKVDSINPATTTLIDPRITALYTKAADLVGIDEAKEELITMLTKGDDMSAQRQRIVSIAGFGGIGKTTLAKAVYDQLQAQFDCTAFVSVSRNPDMKKLLKDILYELDKTNNGDIHSKMLDERQLMDLVNKFLQHNRYLIVIDDIWGIAPWKILESVMSENNMGSRLIITTRIIDVAKKIGNFYYELKPLTHENAGILFYGRIFDSRDKCPRELFEVSEKILKKCGGVPLAIITTSSLLASHKSININDWYEVCDSIGSGLGNNFDMENMRKILCLSYYDLPSHLKTCLIYLGTFPEDYLIRTDRLIWRWIAEGFVHHREGGQSLLELGQSYFNELLNRSMIQPEWVGEEGIPNACRVHDMVLDLICSISREDGFVVTVSGESEGNTPLGSKVRMLSLHNTTWPMTDMLKLRSVSIFSPDITYSISFLSCYHLLRVLDLENCALNNHQNLRFIGNLFHLRFLGLRHTRYAGELPIEVGKLQFLQTLDVVGISIKELPPSIVGLRQLMCLRMDDVRLPNELRNLTSLENLTGTLDSASSAEVLGHLTQLRELLVYVRNGKQCTSSEPSMEKALVQSLGSLHKLQTVVIRTAVAADLDSSVESLGNLRCLDIYEASWLPTWINPASLPLLSSLYICVDKVRTEHIQVLGMLPALRYLEMEMSARYKQVEEERFILSADAFPCARVCKFMRFATVPSMFPLGAAPRLEEFKLCIRMEDFTSNGDFNSLALGHLPCLQRVLVYLHGQRAVSKELVMKVKEVLRHEADVHPNHPSIVIDESFLEYDED